MAAIEVHGDSIKISIRVLI